MLKKITTMFCIILLFISCANDVTQLEADSFESAGFAQSSRMMSKNQSYSKSEVLTDRKIVKNGSVRLEASDFESSEKIIIETVAKYNGYISNSSKYKTEMYFTVKIPAEKFDDFISDAKDIAKVESMSINLSDVTDSYNDLTDKIENEKLLLDKYRKYLAQAKDLKEILEVEKQINELMYQMKNYQDSLARLSKQINLSTISITVVVPPQVEAAEKFSDIADNFKNIGVNILKGFSYLLLGLIYFLVFIIPIGLIFYIFYWLIIKKIILGKKRG